MKFKSFQSAMINFFAILFIYSLNFFLFANEYLDLEDGEKQDFILELKKIHIPGHPHAFNPSIIRWQDCILMSFREIKYFTPLSAKFFNSTGIFNFCGSCIGLIRLDEDFNPIGKAQLLDLKPPHIYSRSEDARLFIIEDRLYIAYSDNRDEVFSEGGVRMYIAELDFDGMNFFLQNMERLYGFEGENKNRREKNWVPFDYNGTMLLAYSLIPHRILKPLLGTGTCESIATSEGSIQWEWGELRGGTPAIPVDGNQYLSFFHSSKEIPTVHSNKETVLHYFMGAYTFSLHPPFEITQISPNPIVGKGFYKGTDYEPYWKPVRVVFPCGIILDDNFIWIAYGRQDHEVWVVKINKYGLLDSLIPVNTIK